MKIPNFINLNDEEIACIKDFTLLWSLFEAKALAANASAQKIISVVHQAVDKGAMEISRHQKTLEYFRERYFFEGEFTTNFNKLNLRRNDNQSLVCEVLSGSNNSPADCISTILIVIYRFRNNLFHGQKWEYELQGQQMNFIHANNVLMTAYDELLK